MNRRPVRTSTTRPCEICRGRCTHKFGVVVGRRPSGMPRLLCGRRQCVREWGEKGADIASRWVENRAAKAKRPG